MTGAGDLDVVDVHVVAAQVDLPLTGAGDLDVVDVHVVAAQVDFL